MANTILRNLAVSVLGAVAIASGTPGTALAATITFDDLVYGVTSYSYDADGDGNNDVTFSTADSSGFGTAGPGANMSYIQEPGLEGTSLLNVDLRVDFLIGALKNLQFSYALNSLSENTSTASFKVFDSNNNLLTSILQSGQYTYPGSSQSNFPEGVIGVGFAGVASYGLFDFSSDYGRYIIDNFEVTVGSAEAVPEPVSVLGTLAFGCWSLALSRKRKHKSAN
jgi:hypothetical protein